MSVDFAALAPRQLRAYANGYTDAQSDHAEELAELHEAIAALETELSQARQTADAIYHDAYCGCRKKIVHETIQAIEVAAHRAAH